MANAHRCSAIVATSAIGILILSCASVGGQTGESRDELRAKQAQARARKSQIKAAKAFAFDGVMLSTSLKEYVAKHKRGSGIARSTDAPKAIVFWKSRELKYPEYPSYRIRQPAISSYFSYYGDSISKIAVVFRKGEGQGGSLSTTKEEPTLPQVAAQFTAQFGEPKSVTTKGDVYTWEVPEANFSLKLTGNEGDWSFIATNEAISAVHKAETKGKVRSPDRLIGAGFDAEVPEDLMPTDDWLITRLLQGGEPTK